MQTYDNNLAQHFKGASLLRFEDKLRQIAETEIEDIEEVEEIRTAASTTQGEEVADPSTATPDYEEKGHQPDQ